MCLFCDCFGPKKRRRKRRTKRSKTPGKTTMAMYVTNWEENIAVDHNMTPEQINDATFAKNIQISDRKFSDRIDLFKDVLQKYELNGVKYVFVDEKTLGKGGFGSVYKIQNIETKEYFALKAMKVKAEGNLKVNRFYTFKQEVFALKKISHKNIIKIIDHFIVDAVFVSFMILEFATEGDLNHRLKNRYEKTGKPFTESEVKRYFAQMANAINCIHDNRIAHKDLKLDNILITKVKHIEVIKVTDFGCAKVAETGVVMEENAAGTVIYMAPETLKVYISKGLKRPDLLGRKKAKRYNPFKADVWSLGVCLYRLLFYDFPFSYDANKRLETLPKMVDSMKTGLQLPNDIPKGLSGDCLSLLPDLIEYNKNKRLSMANIMRHNWVISSPEADSYVPKVPVKFDPKEVTPSVSRTSTTTSNT